MFQSAKDKGVDSLQPLINKPINASIARLDTCSYAINPPQISIFPNPNKFFPNLHSYLPLHDLTSLNPSHAPSPSISTILSQDSEATAKEQDDEQEMRRLKRMISNRESARRSRMRKRKQLENLQSQVLQLLAANHQLAEKLNHVMESNYQILQENARLREESFSLRKSVADLLTSMKSDLEHGGGAHSH